MPKHVQNNIQITWPLPPPTQTNKTKNSKRQATKGSSQPFRESLGAPVVARLTPLHLWPRRLRRLGLARAARGPRRRVAAEASSALLSGFAVCETTRRKATGKSTSRDTLKLGGRVCSSLLGMSFGCFWDVLGFEMFLSCS